MVSARQPQKAPADFLCGSASSNNPPKTNIHSLYTEFVDAYQKSPAKALNLLRDNLTFTTITPEEHVTHVVAILFAQDSTCRAEILKEIAAYSVREGVDTHFFSEVERHEHVQGVLENKWYDQKGLFLAWLATPEGKKVMEPLIADMLQKTIDGEVKELNKKINDFVQVNQRSLLEIYVKNQVYEIAGEQLETFKESLDKAFDDFNDLALIAPEKKAMVPKKDKNLSIAQLVLIGLMLGTMLVWIFHMLLTYGRG